MSDKEYAIEQLARVVARIESAALKANRDAAKIRLIGAAKQQSVQTLASFISAGLQDIGQNYLQEAMTIKKGIDSSKLGWHYIGQIQSNKTADIANQFDWVHSVDRLKIARRLSAQRSIGTDLNVLLQIDIDDEPSKGGTPIAAVPELVEQLAGLERISLRGFMVLPKLRHSTNEQRTPFAKTRELLEHCNQRFGLHMDSLSMGMSADLEAAIAEGATMIRVGTDLFGARPASTD